MHCDHITGANAKTSEEATPAMQPARSGKRSSVSGGAPGFRPASASAAARLRSRSAAERETSSAMRPAASAPQNADITAMAHAGLGWPRKVTQPSSRAKTQAQAVHDG